MKPSRKSPAYSEPSLASAAMMFGHRMQTVIRTRAWLNSACYVPDIEPFAVHPSIQPSSASKRRPQAPKLSRAWPKAVGVVVGEDLRMAESQRAQLCKPGPEARLSPPYPGVYLTNPIGLGGLGLSSCSNVATVAGSGSVLPTLNAVTQPGQGFPHAGEERRLCLSRKGAHTASQC